MADFDLTQSGQEIQDILDGAAMQTDLTAETERAEQAEQQLQDNLDLEETRAKAAEKQNADDIDEIEGKIPAAASIDNQLADKAFVNSSIATATATYRGAYNLVSDLHLTIDATEQQIAAALAGAISTADNNDYCFVQVPTADATPTQIAAIERYKFNGTAWAYEYTLNNSGFTADQWAALNSGITTGLVAKLAALPTNDELTLLLGGKQDVLTFDNVPTEGSNNPVKSGGVKSAIDSEKERAQGAEQTNAGNIAQVIAMIPAAASSENQLADKNFVNSSIATNTATYRGAYNEVSDLSLTVDATHEQIAAALAGEISTADNNDYCFVQIPTADAAPTQIAAIERYKFNGTAWAYEYTLNNSGFTADQWAALNSGITSGLVTKLAALPTNDELVAALAGKQPMLTFDNVPTEGSNNPVKSGGVYEAIAEEAGTRAAAIAAIVALIPSAASALNQLADKAFVNSAISTATAVFKGTFNVVADLELNYNASQVQIALMLGSKIASADNNDYCFVQIPTSNETPLEIARTDRYKYNGTAWAYEYTLNNSGFTAAQWAAINSGITSLLKDKLIDLPTATELTTQLAAKQNALTFDTTPTEGSINPVTSDGIKAAIDTEKARALAAEQGLLDEYNELYALYQTLQGGSIIPVAAADWPVSNPQQNVVYRVANSATPTGYSDYMYNGTNTILLATFTFPGIDSEPTPDSTNLVTSGGTFDAIMQNGPAFDLSAYNAVGGTLATYADLSAALTALNALPAAYKKGGMSMKFVQSSDNKYLQFRYMSSSTAIVDFTNIVNWQKMDATFSFIHTEEYTANASGFKEITCGGFHKGDKVIISLGNGTEIGDVYQRPIASSSTDQQKASKKVVSEEKLYFIASIDFESLYIYFTTAGQITIERDTINNEVYLEDLSPNINSYLYPSTSKILSAGMFNEIPCAFLKGDKVIVKLGENTDIADIYQRPVFGSPDGQVQVFKTATDDGYYFIASIDIRSIFVWCSTAGSVTIERDAINKEVTTENLKNGCVTSDKLAFSLSPLMAYIEATPLRIFDGVYPQYANKGLYGEVFGTYIFDVQNIEKIKITYSNANSAYGIAFSTMGDTVQNFNSGSNANWWYEYPASYGTIELNVPADAKYLAIAQKDMHNECAFWSFLNFASLHINPLYGKKCIYIGDSISTENNYKWKGLLETEYGLEYVRGGSSLWPANGGIKLMPPQIEPESLTQKSIWYRCANQRMNIYNFDIISLFGGTNDMGDYQLKVGDLDENGDYLDIANIIPYVDNASSFSVPSDYNDVWSENLTYAECLKGCIEMLHRDFPSKPIVICTVLPCGSYFGNTVYHHENSPMDGVIMSERLAIIAMRIVNYYQLKGWDIWGVPFYWGVRTVNSVAAFSNWLDPQYGVGVDGVHPNKLCAIKMMNMFKDSMIM